VYEASAKLMGQATNAFVSYFLTFGHCIV